MLKLSLESHIKEVNVVVYNSDGDQIKPTLYEASSGWADWNFMGTQGEWNETIEKFKGSMSYSVKREHIILDSLIIVPGHIIPIIKMEK